MLKATIIGIVSAILITQMKAMKAEYAVWVLLGAGFYFGGELLIYLKLLLEEIKIFQDLFHSYGTYFQVLIKIIGIAYVSEFSSNICKDAGCKSLAGSIEMLAKLSILVLCMPILTALLETMEFFWGGVY